MQAIVMKQLTLKSLRVVPIGLCAVLCLVAYNAKANGYLCPGGAVPNDGGTYSWDDPNWSTVTPCGTPGAWPAGSFAEFHGGVSYTTVVNNAESMAGLFNNYDGGGANTLAINAAGSGSLSIVAAGSLTAGLPVQGFFTGGGSVLINAPMTGAGGVSESAGGGNLELLGNNTYTGGTAFNSSGTLTYFNNNNSFGTGPIVLNGTSFAPILGTGGATITLANTWTNLGNCGVNFAADPNTPLVLTGSWSMTGTLNLRNNGATTSPLTLSGPISGAFAITLSANNAGKVTLSGANTYSGKTTIAAGANVTGVGMTVSVGSLNKVSGGSSSSNLGAPTTVANGTISIGTSTFTSTLIYTGPGETTDRVIDLAGTSGGATLEADGTGPVTFSSAFTASGAGSKTLTLQGSNTGLNTVGGAIVDNSPANKTTVVKAQAGTWRLSGVNTYSGGTTVNAGTLEVAGSIAGSVTQTGGLLQLDTTTALSAAASLTLPNSAGAVNLNFTGSQVINSLTIGGTVEPTGTWGSLTSGAEHTSNVFTGNGLLNVAGKPVVVTQPQSVVAWPDASATFTVVATGAPTYQWKLNGANVGGNSSSLTINPVEAADAGTYVCWLTNAFGYTHTVGAILTVRTTNAYTSIVRGDSPISYWRLDEPNGTIAYDAVGSNNGTYNNAVLNQPNGYSTIDTDACVYLAKQPLGQGSFVSVANYQAFNFFTNPSPQFTLEGWAYFTNITGVQRLFSTDQLAAPGGYMFGISGANQLIFTTSAYQDYPVNLASALSANVWYYLVVACDGSQLHFYVNGQPVGGAFLASSHGGTSGAPMCLGANGNFLSVNGNDNSEQLRGFLDECAIYGSFLGDYEVLQHYNASLPGAPVAQTPVADQPTNYVSLTTTFTENAVGLDLHYQWSKVGSGPLGNDSSTLTIPNMQLSDAGTYEVLVSNGGGSTNTPGATLTVLSIPTTPEQVGLTNSLVLHLPFASDYLDISGHKNNGTNVNSTTLNTDTPVVGGGYLHYSSAVGGPYNYVTLGKPSDLVFGPAGTFSVAFWVRQSGVYTNLPFFGNATNSTARTSVGFALAPGLTSDTPVNPNGAWAWSMSDGTSGFGATGTPGSISDGNWHHLTFVFDRSSSASTYLDGVFQDARNDSFFGGVDSGAVFNIGQDPTGMYDADASADIDDLGLWRRALTQLEVSGMYLAGARNTPGVSFAPAITVIPPSPTTISNIIGTTLTYGGGSGSQFVLVRSSSITAPLAGWTRIATNTSTPGTFTIPAVGTGAVPTFYRVRSE